MNELVAFLKPLLKPCGCAVPQVTEIFPSYQDVKVLVTKRIPDMAKNYGKYVIEYNHGMNNRAPGYYNCEEVLRKNTPDGYLTLTLDVDDDKQVKTAALLAATNEDVRSRIKDEVWEELEPTIAEQADKIPQETVKQKAMKGARVASDESVDQCIDQYFKAWAEKIKKGEDPFLGQSASF